MSKMGPSLDWTKQRIISDSARDKYMASKKARLDFERSLVNKKLFRIEQEEISRLKYSDDTGEKGFLIVSFVILSLISILIFALKY